MSETKPTLNLTALVTKKTRRAKARLMQNFGKNDKTTDELFECYELNFNKQQTVSLTLQKRLKHYLHCIKELHQATKDLSSCMLELYEKDWPKHDVIDNNDFEIDQINDDLEEKIVESVLVPLEQYLSQFSEVKEKIAKRGRKLVDYDSERRTYESLNANQSTRPIDDSKLNKHREQMVEAKKVYESLNNELHEELPALYENRVPLIITVMQRLYSSKLAYHNENINLCKSYLECVDHLAKATDKDYSLADESKLDIPNQQAINNKNSTNTSTQPSTNNNLTSNCRTTNTDDKKQATQTDETTSDKVIVIYKYMAEDEDELSLETGEIIQVVDYDDPAEKEEGWLVGIKENGLKGLFPANFTRALTWDEVSNRSNSK